MSRVTVEQAKTVVRDLLHDHLPKGWVYSMKLSHASNDKPADELTVHDYEWHIWRPEDAGNSFRYYRLQFLGNTGGKFVLGYGNSSASIGSPYEPAMIFSIWTAARALPFIVAGDPPFLPNHDGLT